MRFQTWWWCFSSARLGWIMEKMEWPRPPVLLGLVLGPLAENRLFLSTDNYGLSWTTRPGVLIIFAITLFGIFYPVFKSRRERLASNAAGFRTGGDAAPRWRCISAGLRYLLFIIATTIAVALFQSRNFGFRAGLFPWVIGIPTLLLALVQLTKDITVHKKERADDHEDIPPAVIRRRTLSIIGWTLSVVSWLFGFWVFLMPCRSSFFFI